MKILFLDTVKKEDGEYIVSFTRKTRRGTADRRETFPTRKEAQKRRDELKTMMFQTTKAGMLGGSLKDNFNLKGAPVIVEKPKRGRPKNIHFINPSTPIKKGDVKADMLVLEKKKAETSRKRSEAAKKRWARQRKEQPSPTLAKLTDRKKVFENKLKTPKTKVTKSRRLKPTNGLANYQTEKGTSFVPEYNVLPVAKPKRGRPRKQQQQPKSLWRKLLFWVK